MKKSIFPLLLSALILILGGCAARSTAAPAATAVPDPASAASPAPTMTPEPTAAPAPEETTAPSEGVFVSVDSTREDAYDEDGTLLLAFAYDTPTVTLPGRESIAGAINQVLWEDVRLFREGSDIQTEGNISGRESFVSLAKEDRTARTENGFGDTWCNYALEQTVKSVSVSGRVLSVLYEDYSNSGGAHGYGSCRARSFDLHTGEELTLEAMAVEPSTVSETITAWLTEQSRSEAYARYGFFEDYEAYIGELVTPGWWHLEERGLVFLANAYLLAPYAAGTIEFVMPCDILAGLLREEYLPATKAADGTLEAAFASEGNIVLSADDGTDRQGAQILLTARGEVRDVLVERVMYWESTDLQNGYYTVGTRCLADVLEDGESVSVLTYIPDVMPSLRVSCRGADGVRSFFISQSGEDGSLLLLE